MEVYNRFCAYVKCGKPFTTTNVRTKHCSTTCTNRASTYARYLRRGYLPRGTPRPFICDICKQPGIATTATRKYHPECNKIMMAERFKARRRPEVAHPIMTMRAIKPLPGKTVKYLLHMGCLSTVSVKEIEAAGLEINQAMAEFPDFCFPGRGPIGWKAAGVAA